MLDCTACLNPGAFTVSLYSPTGSCASRNSPDALDTVVYFSCVPVSTASIVALGTVAPEGSLTRPEISAVFIWPNADDALKTKMPARATRTPKVFVDALLAGVPQDERFRATCRQFTVRSWP